MEDDLLYTIVSTAALFVGRSWLRFLIVCGGAFALFWVVYADRFAHRRCQPTVPDRSVNWMEFRNSMIGILFFLTPSVLAVPLYFSGHLQLIVDPWATPPLVQVISFVLFIIGADAWFYWTHRAMHHPKLYMATHELHHKAEQPSPLSGYAFSMIEGFVLGMYLPVVLLIVPVNGVVLAIFVQVFAVLEAYVHLGYEILPNGVARHPIGKHLGTSVFHNMHHEDGAFNFGVYFTWWDRLMGTMHPEYEDRYEAVTARRLFAGAVLEGADT